MSTNAKPYRDTLNLPVTRFEMKANLAAKEPALQARWRSEDLEAAIRRKGAGRPRRVLHDGPPYANGDIHIGHLLNKVLKDIIARFFTMRGYDSPYVPGWDCHGLPIEHKVMKALGSKAATLEPIEVRALCRDEALKWVAIQREQFRRLGIGGDWDHPYLTLDPGYESAVLDVLADLLEAGYVRRQLKPIHWCPTDRTALAEAELEYSEERSPSLYARFRIDSATPDVWGPGPWQALIWTTTPWTLPANVAIAAHPKLSYAAVRYRDPSTGDPIAVLLAESLIPKVLGLAGVSDFEVVAKLTGRELEGMTYRHPFLDRMGVFVLADYVTVEDGTGLVHTAPGHGAEDYRTGQLYGLETISPVDNAGRFDDTAPDWLRGQKVLAANPVVVDRLREIGALHHSSEFAHSYPHCWRCKSSVIFRATSQWFVAVDHEELRSRTLGAIGDEVRWMPDWGRSRIDAMVANRPDWCISRQRHWGIPIPAFECEGCGELLLTAASTRHVRDLVAADGTDVWYRSPVEELLPPGAACGSCGSTAFAKTADILDVWFESGSSHRAVLSGGRDLGFPAYLYLEGSDQHRGWFMSSILTAMATEGRPPFQNVLTHGFAVDEKGRKMSKSLGNVVPAVESVERQGADVLRLYVASLDYADDVRIGDLGIKEASESYRKIRNTFRFLLGNLGDYEDFDPTASESDQFEPIDRWLLGRLNGLVGEVTAHYEAFELYRVHQKVYGFCANDLSSLYLDVLKDRLYADPTDGPGRRAARSVLARVHQVLVRLIAPILPHTAEEIWGFLPSGSDRPSSVHLSNWPEPDPTLDDPALRDQFTRLLAIRERINAEAIEPARKAKAIRGNTEALVNLTGPPDDLDAIAPEVDLLKTLCGVAEIRLTPAPGAVGMSIEARKSDWPKCERCWTLRPDVGEDPRHPTLCVRCARVVGDRLD